MGNELNTISLLLSVCNNFWLRANVDFDQMMRQKYVFSNILQ